MTQDLIERTTYGWAVLFPVEGGWSQPGAPLMGTINGTRKLSMTEFVSWWRSGADAGRTTAQVWRRAYRRGWRLARVSITPAPEYGR